MMLNVQLDILLSLNYRLTTDTPACSVLRQLNIHNAAAEQGTWSTELGVYLMPVNELKMLMLLLLVVVTGGDRHAASSSLARQDHNPPDTRLESYYRRRRRRRPT